MEESEDEQISAARIKSLEKEMGTLKEQFNLYVLLRENDLHFKSIYTILSLKEKQLDSVNAQLIAQNIEALGRETAQRQEWAGLHLSYHSSSKSMPRCWQTRRCVLCCNRLHPSIRR